MDASWSSFDWATGSQTRAACPGFRPWAATAGLSTSVGGGAADRQAAGRVARSGPRPYSGGRVAGRSRTRPAPRHKENTHMKRRARSYLLLAAAALFLTAAARGD